MKTPRRTSASLSIVCALALTHLPQMIAAPAPEGNAKALMEEARKKQTERKRAEMQRELDRVAEDVKKGRQELGELETSMSKVGYAVAETKTQIDQLAGRKKRAGQDLELLPMRMEADRLKTDALNLLNAAHAKAGEAIKRRQEELELKAALVAAQLHKLEDAEIGAEPGAKGESVPTVTELQKSLQKAEDRSALATVRAREAMDAAAAKLQQAEAAAAKAEKKQAEFEKENASPAPGAAGTEPVTTLKAKKTR